jgi:hypothetical protein
MIQLNLNTFKNSAEVFLFANTPNYLYKHLRELNEVQRLAENLTSKELYDACSTYLDKTVKTFENELGFYITLIALSFKDYSEANVFLRSLNNKEYKWSDSILTLINAKRNPSTVAHMELKQIKKSEQVTSKGDAASSFYKMPFPKAPKMVVLNIGQVDSTTSQNEIRLEDTRK